MNLLDLPRLDNDHDSIFLVFFLDKYKSELTEKYTNMLKKLDKEYKEFIKYNFK
jgi:hypothetical protein